MTINSFIMKVLTVHASTQKLPHDLAGDRNVAFPLVMGNSSHLLLSLAALVPPPCVPPSKTDKRQA